MTDLAAVSWSPDRIDLLWVGEDWALWHRAFSAGTWSEPTALGGTLASGPAVTAWTVDQLQVFAVFPDGELWNRYWDGSSWHDWESLGGELDPGGQPAASSWSADPDRRVRTGPGPPDVASLVGRHPVGRLGEAVSEVELREVNRRDSSPNLRARGRAAPDGIRRTERGVDRRGLLRAERVVPGDLRG